MSAEQEALQWGTQGRETELGILAEAGTPGGPQVLAVEVLLGMLPALPGPRGRQEPSCFQSPSNQGPEK